MSVHDDTLQGLKEALEYVSGDKTKGKSTTIAIPDDDIRLKFNRLTEEEQKAITIIIDKMLVTDNKQTL